MLTYILWNTSKVSANTYEELIVHPNSGNFSVLTVNSEVQLKEILNAIYYETDVLLKYHLKKVEEPSPFSSKLKEHLDNQGYLQVDTSSKLSVGAKALLTEAIQLTSKGILVEISGIHKVKTFTLPQTKG